ncbi:sulfotransferase family 2 domain-containing protein [Vibrio aestuarianus]|uniref:Sulfotransferase family 2 domain-containing protein n=1 Tax=Vibrio aestuarianus TaxID=28171 RepID=A0AAX3U290_9VIBR|nr:sulfotransferase family 2 domain-containing protein [Vibrio aestuarianus]WGK81286.1 sulfotransferase family 2 domain-containing protein [Vibrio aestuarianus]
MLITKDFVMLNFPKTGSTFVRKMFFEYFEMPLYDNVGNIKDSDVIFELWLPKIFETNHYNILEQHGTAIQIPLEHQKKEIVSVIRDPLDRYISTYFFKWWEKHPPAPEIEVKKKYPNYPNLTFGEYFEMMHIWGRENRLKDVSLNCDIGLNTIQFIQFYFKNPIDVLNKIDDDYIDSNLFYKDMFDIKFLRQSHLNEDLISYLSKFDFNEGFLSSISETGKIHVTGSRVENEDSMAITDELKQELMYRERLVYKVLQKVVAEYESDKCNQNITS